MTIPLMFITNPIGIIIGGILAIGGAWMVTRQT